MDLKRLTLQEKCALLSAIDRWRTTPISRVGIPSVRMSDGPHGMRVEDEKNHATFPATCFPSAVTLASSWDRSLVADVARAIASEAAKYGVDTVLGPGVNIKRNPLCGRNFEYFSEDPLVAGTLGSAYVNAMQEEGVGTSLKHFAANSQEFKRYTMSSEVDERALREIYLSAYERIVKEAAPYTVMSSYNRVNGEYSSENKRLLTDILREEWGYKGIVISDWGATNDRVEGVRAGLDIEMPSSDGVNDKMVEQAVLSGKLSEEEVDKRVQSILEYIEKSIADREKSAKLHADFEKNHRLAVRAASEGAVLLKNDNVLPAKETERVLVIGRLADKMRFQGGGSSNINAVKPVSFLEKLQAEKINYEYEEGYPQNGSVVDKKLLDKAVEKAKGYDRIFLFVGLTDDYESEGYDRKDLRLPLSHNALIEKMVETGKKVTVVLSCGSPVEMPWIDDVGAVLNMYLGGEGGGEACFDLLFGRAVPCGKLAETFPLSLNDNFFLTKYYHEGPQTVEYRESIFVGYRYYDAAKKKVLFPFGFGLSYTDFEYSDLEIVPSEEGAEVCFTVKNIGLRAGKEISQVYIGKKESAVLRAEKQLVGFEKTSLEPGEIKRVRVILPKRAFSFYDTERADWTVEEGEYDLFVGASSRDIRLSGTYSVEGEKISDRKSFTPTYLKLGKATDIPDGEFLYLFGHEPSSNAPYTRKTICMAANIADTEKLSLAGKITNFLAKKLAVRFAVANASDAVKERVSECATVTVFRSFAFMSEGRISYRTAEGCMYFLAGRYCKGLWMMTTGFITQIFHKKKIKTYGKK